MNFSIGEILSNAVSRVATAVETQDETTNEVIRFLGTVQAHAFGTWSTVHRQGQRCSVRMRAKSGVVKRCRSHGAAVCVVCRQPTCFEHGLFASDGQAVCRSCVEAIKNPAGRPDKASEMRRHLKTLGLRRGATADDVRAAYKKLAVKWHPDKFQGSDKDRAHEKFVAIGAAKDWLLKHLEDQPS